MDLQRLKQLSEAKIKAGTITKQVRDTLKEYKHDKQDLQQGLSETFKPIIKCHCLRKCSRGQNLWSTDLAETWHRSWLP